MRLSAALVLPLFFTPLALTAQGQVTLSGRVLEFGSRSGVVAAAVVVPAVGQVTTGPNGEFRLPRMAPGQRTVTISALGYQTRELQLNVQRDTTIVVELEVQALKVDSLRVEARTITVRGSVRDGVTRDPVFDADITVANSKSASSNVLGNFRVRGAPAGVPVAVKASAPGYLPYTATITADRDTTLLIELAVDPVGQQMLAEQVERLRKRSQGVNARLESWNNDVLAQSLGWTVVDYLKTHNLVRPVCLYADDVDKSSWLPDVLNSYMIDELDRIEAYDRGLMLRIYTRRYIAKQSSSKDLPRIVYMRFGRGKPVCM